MRMGRNASGLFGIVVISLLGGCAQNTVRPVNHGLVPVKTILQDVDAYRSSEFTPSALPGQVLKTIMNADSQPVGFHRLLLDTYTTSVENGGASIKHFTNHDLYENEGNGLVSAKSTLSSNDIQLMMIFNLSYRNIYSVRSQNVPLNAANAYGIIETHLLSHFDAAAMGHEIMYSYDSGYVWQTRNYGHAESKCVFGRTFDASEINPAIQGSVRDLDCHVSNQNGVVISNEHRVYLDRYGFAILLGRKNAAQDITFKVTSFKAD
ncbi:hypothetical protein [Rhodanobacter sp. B05]|uniref:hypothetical protein n=1 Tax=Rhodanobacter sp. B05 TaxID=1945859 RepID=UPI0011155639|nr:hypothetical protein [Rhodanobacter sp. B05]